jgi:hypothetical protein
MFDHFMSYLVKFEDLNFFRLSKIGHHNMHQSSYDKFYVLVGKKFNTPFLTYTFPIIRCMLSG